MKRGRHVIREVEAHITREARLVGRELRKEVLRRFTDDQSYAGSMAEGVTRIGDGIRTANVSKVDAV